MSIEFGQQYFGSQIGSSFGTMRNETFIIPSTTLCVPLVLSELYDITDSIQTLNEQDFLFAKQLSIIELNQLISDKNKSSFWPTAFMRISHQYLVLVNGYKTMDRVDLSALWKNYIQQSHPLNSSRTAEDILGTGLEFLNISSYEFMQKFGEELRRNYTVNVTRYFNTNGLLNGHVLTLSQISTTFVSKTEICFSLPSRYDLFCISF